MSHWKNSTNQLIGSSSGQPCYVDFDTIIINGDQSTSQDGIYHYSYVINLCKPTLEGGPTRVSTAMYLNQNIVLSSFSNCEIDTGAKETLCNTGEIVLLKGTQVQVGVFAHDGYNANLITTSEHQCNLTIRKIADLG